MPRYASPETDPTLGPRLRSGRVLAGLTREQAALAIGACLASLENWEAGRAEPKARFLPRMAKAYGCSLEALLNPAPVPVAIPANGRTE